MFDNCASLGWFCGTASSLSKLGLRSFSGPFDWYFSNDYSSVISLVENGFQDFMNRENLKPSDVDLQWFMDEKYDFFYLHDNDDRDIWDVAYPKIYEKYKRRADKFLEVISKPTCLFRNVKSNEEIDYINQNYEFINDVFKSYNSENVVTYVLMHDLKDLDAHCVQFKLDITDRPDKEETMRLMFDHSKELLDYCDSLISEEQRNKNLKFDYETKSYWWIS